MGGLFTMNELIDKVYVSNCSILTKMSLIVNTLIRKFLLYIVKNLTDDYG